MSSTLNIKHQINKAPAFMETKNKQLKYNVMPSDYRCPGEEWNGERMESGGSRWLSSRTQHLSKELKQVGEYPHGHFMEEHAGTKNSMSEAQSRSMLALNGQSIGQSGWIWEGPRSLVKVWWGIWILFQVKGEGGVGFGLGKTWADWGF